VMHKFDPGAFERLLREEREIEERPREILIKFGIAENLKVIEIGCGPGFYLPFIKTIVGKNGIVIGSDIQLEMLRIAKTRLNEHNLKNVYLTMNSEELLPFKSESFDFVIIAHTLHELNKPAILLREVHRILKWNGVLALWDWDRNYDGPPGPPQEERFYPEQAEKYLKISGFTVYRLDSLLPYRYFMKAIKKGVSDDCGSE